MGTNTTDLPPPRAIVLDTAALIAGTENLYALGGLVDAASGQPLERPSEALNVRFYVTPDVAAETRDPRARERLVALDRLGVIEQRVPSAEAVVAVSEFSKATGDYPVLSTTDLRVIALCWMLEVERSGLTFLNDRPEAKRITEIRGRKGLSFEQVEQMEREEMGRREEEMKADDGWTTVENAQRQPVRKGKKKGKKKKKRRDVTQVAHQVGDGKGTGPTDEDGETLQEGTGKHEEVDIDLALLEATSDLSLAEAVSIEGNESKVASSAIPEGMELSRQASNSQLHNPGEANGLAEQGAGISHDRTGIDGSAPEAEGELADSDDGIGWINEDNLEEHLARDGGEEAASEEDRKRVACVTTDFAMQNTMLQMGLKLLSVDGRRTIRQIKRFALRCQSCGAITRELQRKFCEQCGNATMHRVAFKVDKKGVARTFVNPKKKPNLRGTKYPIPMLRGGRHNKDLILCEDQIDPVKQRRLNKQREKLNVDVLDPSNFYNAGARFDPNRRPLIVGYGRRNPNEVRATTKGKR